MSERNLVFSGSDNAMGFEPTMRISPPQTAAPVNSGDKRILAAAYADSATLLISFALSKYKGRR